ncbi:uncharacterized protein si:cabz01007807.1 isoform X3 [Clarias gariepinus]|uniref:uncharacterized protein si:cabz01007807.1 isoform X3 n=1 Tax=Clarias gariepinus TaxID=13013 RepID=UPI00234D9D08|nr:uncharacterized protein si:cabz01007807.1 isoform X3 [Clarias gariepinus]
MLSHRGYMELQDDHIGRETEVTSFERSSNTVNGFSLSTSNPFITQNKESSVTTVSNDINKDIMSSHGQSNGWSRFPISPTTPLENDWAVFPPPTLALETNQTAFPSQKPTSHFARFSPSVLSNQETNIFHPFKEETGITQRMVANEKPSDKKDFLLEYILANQTNDEEPIPSTTASSQLNIFEDFPSFLPPPVINKDIFTSTVPSQSNDIFQTPKSSVHNRVFQFNPTSASIQNDNFHLFDNSTGTNGQFKQQDSDTKRILMPAELSNGIFQETTLTSPFNASTNEELMFTRLPLKPVRRHKSHKNPKNIDHDIFSTPTVSVPADQKPAETLLTSTPATPVSIPAVPRATINIRNIDHDIFSTPADQKPAQNLLTSIPVTPISIPAALKPTTNMQDTMPADEVNQSQVYEDILFIGQEKCVEDWPEDSPELSPDWKPTGKLKLRRESLRESKAATTVDTFKRKSGKTKIKLRHSRRESKETSDGSNLLQAGVDHQVESEEKGPDNVNGAYGDTLSLRSKLPASEGTFLHEQEEQNAVTRSKSFKSKKTKFIVPHLQYRGTKKNSLGDVLENGSPFLQNSEESIRAENKHRRFSADVYAEYEDDTFSPKSSSSSGKIQELQDCRPKKPIKFTFHHASRKGSKGALENYSPEKGADLFKASDIKGSEISVSEDYIQKKPIKFTFPHASRKGSKGTLESYTPEKGADLFKASDINGSDTGVFEHYSQAEHEDDPFSPKSSDSSGKIQELQDYRPKKPIKFKFPHASRKGSKGTLENYSPEKGADLFKASDINGSEISVSENYSQMRKSPVQRISPIIQRDLKAEHEDDPFSPKSSDNSGKIQELQDYRPKKPIKFTFPQAPRKGSRGTLENYTPEKGADLFKASDIYGSEISVSENYSQAEYGDDPFSPKSTDSSEKIQESQDYRPKKPIKFTFPHASRKGSKGTLETFTSEKGADLFKASDINGSDTGVFEHYSQMRKSPVQSIYPIDQSETKAKDQMRFPEDIEPPGATSGNFYLSEAAKAEWMSSQMDVRRARAPDDNDELEGVKEEEEGDTDSLMEWWNTVELWDELPSDEETSEMEDETKSFTEIADKVHHGLRVFYKIFIEQAEVLYQHVLRLYAIGEDISNFHRNAKIANITSGTTTAVGGVTAIAGLALAPVTFGASLIASAVGLGIATAGGIAAASASISDNVHDMNDRKKIEVVVQDYETRLVELRRCLRFVAEGVHRLRIHPLLRRNNYYAGDWEVRRALQTISLVGEPVEQAENIVERSTNALNSVCKGMDNYFSKDSKEMKKGCKKEVTTQVNMLAKLLHEGLVSLNSIREQLMEATGEV